MGVLAVAAAHAGQPVEVAEELGSLNAQLRTSEAALLTTRLALDQVQVRVARHLHSCNGYRSDIFHFVFYYLIHGF